jgi:hypothetical protein
MKADLRGSGPLMLRLGTKEPYRGHTDGIQIYNDAWRCGVECGYERVAEFQKEVLSLAQAAHFPVIWATQVLDGRVKTGRPCRAEVTDAGRGERAECVMLNKGPHIVEAIPDVGLHPATRSGPATALVIL